jgi:hypothetical protein
MVESFPQLVDDLRGFFIPINVYAGLIVNKTYDPATGYSDIDYVEGDAKRFLETCEFLGIKDDHIFKFKDTNYDAMTAFKC